MKLCRFELASEPGSVRSGFLHGNKVYETDGTQPTAVHDWADLVPLSPIGRPPSIRLFRPGGSGGFAEQDEAAGSFRYLNPSALIAPSRELKRPAFTDLLDFEPCIGAIVAGPGYEVSPEDGDEMILGFTIANCFVARDHFPAARAYDVAVACGPFLTTPDELAETVVQTERGPAFEIGGLVRVNGVEIGAIDLTEMTATLGELISAASHSCPLSEGDLVLYGPLWVPDEPRSLDPPDEVQVFIDRLGTLGTRIV